MWNIVLFDNSGWKVSPIILFCLIPVIKLFVWAIISTFLPIETMCGALINICFLCLFVGIKCVSATKLFICDPKKFCLLIIIIKKLS